MPRKSTDVEQERYVRLLAEDEASSPVESSDNDLDIIKTTRKSLDLSQYIDALTQSTQNKTQLQADEEEEEEEATVDDSGKDHGRRESKQTRHKSESHPGSRRPGPFEVSDDDDGQNDLSLSEWSEEDRKADYLRFKERHSLKRKRVAAETKRIRSEKKSRAIVGNSIVGRRPKNKPQSKVTSGNFSAGSGTDEGVNETYLDDPTPEYIETRKLKLKRLHDAGLRYPPSYDDVDFSDSDSEEKPAMPRDVKPQQKKVDIPLRQSGATIPAPIAQWLRNYQVEGVRFLHERFVRQTGAILGDDMGLGKTIQVIAFLTAAFGKSALKRDAKCMRKVRRIGDDRWYPRVLIVCPGTLMENWDDELRKWGWWQVYHYHGAPEDRRGVLGAARKGMCEIMITTYDTYRINEGEINTVDWDCIIADECHIVKNRNAAVTKAMNKVNALCRIGLTGTAIQNKYEELWNLLNWARPGEYGSAQEWKQKVSTPLKIGQAHDATMAQLADARIKAKQLVNGILPDVFLRRMKSLIAEQLPKKTDRVVFCQLTESQANAYQSYIESERCEFIRRAKEDCDCGSGKKRGWCCYIEVPEGGKWLNYMFPCMITLQKLANHVALLLPRTSDLSEKQAKDLENLQLAFPETWKDLYRVKDRIFDHSQREFCGKWKVLKRLLEFWHSNKDKVLIFSHSVRLLRLLKVLFDVDGTKYNSQYLDGSMTYKDRAKAVADFNSDPLQFVFLISTKAGGIGLNITSANKVVVVDPNWNPAYDLQAQDRAYRIGQTRDVEVFRLVSSGTIEEIVYARQIYKQQQANIGYTASNERRYFKGVMDTSGKVGELFGLENLFSFEETGYLLRDIVHKTNVAETRAGVSAMDFKADENDISSDDDDILSDKALGIIDEDDGNQNSQIKKFAEEFVSFADEPLSKSRGKKKYRKRTGPDPINAILAKAGVQYTHENSEVIGRSKIEARLSRHAVEVRNDLELGRRPVFQFSQSQSQGLQLETDQNIRYSSDEDEDDLEDDVRVTGERKVGAGKDEFKIRYRYRPNEEIRRRQFCSIAQKMGYDDPVQFALMVEEMTLEERRKVLGKFYRTRRREILEEFKGK